MENNNVELPFLSNIGFMLLYKCTIACPHCIVDAGPHRNEEMSTGDCLSWIRHASKYRNGHIIGLALTGGEPFYNIEKLTSISDYGNKLGFIVSVVTNAFWANTKEIAVSILSKLPAIKMISISTDVYHQKYIPLNNVMNVIQAARELRMFYNIALCTDNKKDPQYRKIIDKLKEFGEAERLRETITFPVGRALKHSKNFKFEVSHEPSSSACSMASSPVAFPDGNVYACIGPILTLPANHQLFLGNLYNESLEKILNRAEVNPVLHVIRSWGPHKLISYLKEQGFDSLLPREYIRDCPCDVCYKLMSDKKIIDALEIIMKNKQIKDTIAYARVYYLNETAMVERFKLYEPENIEISKDDSSNKS